MSKYTMKDLLREFVSGTVDSVHAAERRGHLPRFADPRDGFAPVPAFEPGEAEKAAKGVGLFAVLGAAVCAGAAASAADPKDREEAIVKGAVRGLAAGTVLGLAAVGRELERRGEDDDS